jgi:ribosomal protein S18 acetylase RimI-like enzyme
MDVEIRPLRAGDYEQWLVLWRGYLTFYETTVDNDVTAETWRRLLDPEHTIKGFCAVDAKGHLVGIVHYLFHPVTWAKSDRCYLEDLFVSPDARVKGAGRALIEAVYRAAEKAGADQVYWLTAQSNVTARRLYDRIGQVTPFIKYRN